MLEDPDFALSAPGDPVREAVALRDYQRESIDALRNGVRAGHRSQVLSSPTGSGKTVVATHLMQEASNKLSRAVFVCDRVALVDQTSAMFDSYGIAHGVVQANHWRARPWERIQVASAQTLARRGLRDEPQLLVWDECHTLYKSVCDYVKEHPNVIVVGLTATPFTKGMGSVFTNVVNVTTTDRLIADGFLVPVKTYAGKAADMTGAKTKFDGEWAEAEMEERGLTIIGDVVSEWIAKTQKHFNGPVKTIVFSATVAHGDELCKRFQEAGFNFQQISYKDGNDERRRALIEEFRKSDSEITGLVSCEALAKGFDVPDILCGISARPYRKSLSGHIQQLGRIMRPAPGKEFALWLDHSGNFLRFLPDTQEVFAAGVSKLDEERDAKVRKEPTQEDKNNFACRQCGYLMGAKASHCPACGWERPRTRSDVREVGGELVEVTIDGKAAKLPSWAQDKDAVWRQLCYMGLERKHGDIMAAEKFAKAQYRNMYGGWPRFAMRNVTPEPPDPRLERKVQQQLIAYFKRRKAA